MLPAVVGIIASKSEPVFVGPFTGEGALISLGFVANEGKGFSRLNSAAVWSVSNFGTSVGQTAATPEAAAALALAGGLGAWAGSAPPANTGTLGTVYSDGSTWSATITRGGGNEYGVGGHLVTPMGTTVPVTPFTLNNAPGFFNPGAPNNVLSHFNGVDGSTTFVEESGKTFTTTGSGIALNTAQSKFGSASVTGFGSGRTLSVSHSSVPGDFTLAAWFYWDGTTGGNKAILTTTGNNPGAREPTELYLRSGSGNALTVYSSDANQVIGSVPSANAWHLACLERVGSTVCLTLDGVSQGTYTDSRTFSPGDLHVGSYYDGSETWAGYIDEIYFRTDSALFGGGSFTPPAAPFIAGALLLPVVVTGSIATPPPTDPYFSSVSLLMHFEGANGSTTLTDSSLNAYAITSSGVTITTTTPLIGTASGQLSSSSYAYLDGQAMEFGSGDFTVEFWLKPTATPPSEGTILSNYGSSGNRGIDIRYSGDKIYSRWSYNGASDAAQAVNNTFIALNSTHHVAVVRNGSSVTVYVDGVGGTSMAITGAIHTGANTYIGCTPDVTPVWFYTGFLDELRITKGLARYTADFTPAAAPFPDQ